MKAATSILPVFMKLALVALLLLTIAPAAASATVSLDQQVAPAEISVGQRVYLTFTVQGGTETTVQLPPVDGLFVEGSSTTTQVNFANGILVSTTAQTFDVIPRRAGEFTIPAFEIHTHDGETLHAHAMKFHVAEDSAPTAANAPAPANTGPVVMPPAAQAPSPEGAGADASTNQASTNVNVPIDSDHRPAKVFMVITAKTTDAYVGESIPVRIEFYLRLDSMAQQDSLPTVEGSDFLMNDLSVRPAEDEVSVLNEMYQRTTWLTCIAASRSGDFPLVMSRDTYWNKNSRSLNADPLGNFFSGRNNLAHANIDSNKLLVHARPLPAEGRPAGFTGAIGQFRAVGNATATRVDVGDPTYLDFSVSGQGNFNSVHAPTLAPDPNWKTYVSSSQLHFVDESHIEGEKAFHQALIPLKNGLLPLPEASFSYFDPYARQYFTIPIALPVMTVSGTPLSEGTTNATAAPTSVIAATPAGPSLLGNRKTLGEIHATLLPVYQQTWFWLSQGAVLALGALALVAFALKSRQWRDRQRAEAALRRQTLQGLKASMAAAVQTGDGPAFFLAARRAVQLRWSERWGMPPESVSLPVITARDPDFARLAAPLFQQADEVMYSGHAPAQLDLVSWDRHVLEQLLLPQPA